MERTFIGEIVECNRKEEGIAEVMMKASDDNKKYHRPIEVVESLLDTSVKEGDKYLIAIKKLSKMKEEKENISRENLKTSWTESEIDTVLALLEMVDNIVDKHDTLPKNNMITSEYQLSGYVHQTLKWAKTIKSVGNIEDRKNN